jgi:hypothetical protein
LMEKNMCKVVAITMSDQMADQVEARVD